ncbi:MAG: cell division protein FtsH, partial [Actinomycetota bacterium]|nr:cell division protein FtsH [Actinomycetota bacterium]
NAARRKVRHIQTEDFNHALERVVAGMQSRRTMTDHERRVIAYHEGGHALCGELLPTIDPVHRISIVPRGQALGYTLSLPEEDHYLKTREELIDVMTMALGGRAAEELVFGSVTTGAREDLRQVANIAGSMVHEYAMGTGVTSLRLADGTVSEATQRASDREVRELADEAMRAAIRILDEHRPQLDEVAATLLAREVIEREDILRIMHGARSATPARGSSARIGLAAATAMNPAPPPHTPRP